MKHYMLDLETLGRRAGCKILSIGVVEMNFERPIKANEFYIEVDRYSQPGMHEDPDTLEFWESQAPSVRDRLFSGSGKPDLQHALESLRDFLRRDAEFDDSGHAKVCVWGNGSDFDNAILMAGYDAVGLEVPWPFWNNRCYRTLKNLVRLEPHEFVGEKHNALDDARNQARHAERIVVTTRVDHTPMLGARSRNLSETPSSTAWENAEKKL